MKLIKEWGKAHGIELNLSKSAALLIRVDRRTPAYRARAIAGVPVVHQFRYLGVLIDDAISFKPMQQKFNQTVNTFQK